MACICKSNNIEPNEKDYWEYEISTEDTFFSQSIEEFNNEINSLTKAVDENNIAEARKYIAALSGSALGFRSDFENLYNDLDNLFLKLKELE